MAGGIAIAVGLALVTLAYLVARIIARCEFGPTEELWLDDYAPWEGEATRESGAGGRASEHASRLGNDARTRHGGVNK